MDERWTDSNGLREHVVSHNGKNHKRVEHVRAATPSRTLYRRSLADAAQSYLRLVRLSVAKTSSTSVRSMLAERFLSSVLAMLIGFVIFWTSFIFVILSGLSLTLALLIAVLRRCGRSVRSLLHSIRN